MLNIQDVGETFEVKVLVQFQQAGGTIKQGDFMATFRRPPQHKLDEMIDDKWGNSDMLDECLISVSGIGKSPTESLPDSEQLAFVKRTPECVQATVAAFFKATRAERYTEGTSKKRSSRG